MSLIQDAITLNNLFLLGVFFLAMLTYKKGWKSVRMGWGIIFLMWLLCATTWLPSLLVKKYEAQISVCQPQTLDKTKTYHIHVLGAGYSLDPRLPATAQLSQVTLSRLVEGIRIARQLPKYTLVTSAFSSLGLEPQASVAKRAAIDLNIPPQNIKMLTTPSNTSEEVQAFVQKFGQQQKVIVVSDAMHLPRAKMLYAKHGIKAITAPSSYKVLVGPNDVNGIRFPNLASMDLMNEYLREQLKYFKDSW